MNRSYYKKDWVRTLHLRKHFKVTHAPRHRSYKGTIFWRDGTLTKANVAPPLCCTLAFKLWVLGQWKEWKPPNWSEPGCWWRIVRSTSIRVVTDPGSMIRRRSGGFFARLCHESFVVAEVNIRVVGSLARRKQGTNTIKIDRVWRALSQRWNCVAMVCRRLTYEAKRVLGLVGKRGHIALCKSLGWRVPVRRREMKGGRDTARGNMP